VLKGLALVEGSGHRGMRAQYGQVGLSTPADAGRLAAMTGVQLRPIKLRKWFPPQDTVATMVAMLCILREDLLLELYGITNEHIPRLDDNDSGYRRTYFWRNSLRTLTEIKKVLTRLNFRDGSGA
jgi:hypothetical protein